MKPYIAYSFLLLLTAASTSYAQWFPEIYRKGDFFGGWGWNRSSYTTSDIQFHGEDYNFTLYNVQAKDRQTQFEAKTYFGLKTMTIPQTNMKLGYFVRDNIAVTVGFDHMKYVMVQNQSVAFQGFIDDVTYMNMVDNGLVKLTPEFLTFEHTDGLNYLLSEIEFYQGIFSGSFIDVSAYGGLGAGALMPKSNVKLMNYPRNDEFHFAGFGINTKCGAEVLLGNHFYVRGEAKYGYINMPDIVTRAQSISDRASQQFGFAAINFMLGFNITPKKSTIQPTENASPTAG